MGERPGGSQCDAAADGNGEFTRKMGLLVDKSDSTSASAPWRYSMLVRDGVIEKMFIEPDEPGRPVRRLGCRYHAHLPEPEGEKTRSGGYLDS
jgi:peroxiredoxin